MSNQAVSPVDWASPFVCQHLDWEHQREMLNIAYSLRHQVYCQECNFLPTEQYADGLETDQFDEQSAHFSAHNALDELIGYVRLVPVRENGIFPFEQHCQELFPHIEQPPRDQAAEISRLIIRRDYRRRKGDTISGVTIQTIEPNGNVLVHNRRKHPVILLGLFRQMYMYSIGSGIRYWYAAMERPLNRILSQFGFIFTQVSPEIDYYGLVACYLADLRKLEEDLHRTNPALLMWFRQDIS